MPMIRKFAFSAIVALLAVVANADGWPQYRGSQGDGKTSGRIGGSLQSVWKASTPLGFSSFSVADGKAFTLVSKDNVEHCLALDASSGATLWNTPLGGSSKYSQGGGNAGAKNNKGGDGPRSTPSTDGKHVYVYDSYMVLSCLDAMSGKIVWQRDVVKEHAGRNIKWLNATSPVLDGDHLFIAGGGSGETFLAINKDSGDVVWKSGDDTMTHATPVLTTIRGKKQLVFFMKSGLVGIDPETGAKMWSTFFKFSTSTAASPVIENDLVYCSAGYSVGAGLFQVNGGEEPEEKWFKANQLMNHWSTPVVHNGHLYGLFEFKKYGTAPLQCVELETGKIKWSERGFGPGNCILVGETLIVLSDAGEVVLVDADPQGYTETARITAVEGKCWSTPAYSDGKIYVRSTKEAACLAIK